jgi:glycosyltransferase involved in cell wall biosynthesis
VRSRGAGAIDVLLVSLGTTGGLRTADDELRDSILRAGASVELVRPEPPGEVRTMALTDLRAARAVRGAVLEALRGRVAESVAAALPRSVIYSSTTAALLWPRPGAIRFDAPAAANRPGRHGLWQRPLERRRLREAPLLLPWSPGALAELPAGIPEVAERALVLPIPVEPSEGEGPGGEPSEQARPVEPSGEERPARARGVAAITYGANPFKKGLDRVLGAWREVARPGEELLVAGASTEDLRAAGIELPAEGVRVTGALAPAEYRALLRRARLFLCAPRREDYGIAQLEALIEGCLLVSTPAPGPYAALGIARELDPRLIVAPEGLGTAVRCALDDPAPDYAPRALRALEPFRRAACDRIVAEELLPRLLG